MGHTQAHVSAVRGQTHINPDRLWRAGYAGFRGEPFDLQLCNDALGSRRQAHTRAPPVCQPGLTQRAGRRRQPWPAAVQ
jgi:hypothetical protein